MDTNANNSRIVQWNILIYTIKLSEDPNSMITMIFEIVWAKCVVWTISDDTEVPKIFINRIYLQITINPLANSTKLCIFSWCQDTDSIDIKFVWNESERKCDRYRKTDFKNHFCENSTDVDTNANNSRIVQWNITNYTFIKLSEDTEFNDNNDIWNSFETKCVVWTISDDIRKFCQKLPP